MLENGYKSISDFYGPNTFISTWVWGNARVLHELLSNTTHFSYDDEEQLQFRESVYKEDEKEDIISWEFIMRLGYITLDMTLKEANRIFNEYMMLALPCDMSLTNYTITCILDDPYGEKQTIEIRFTLNNIFDTKEETLSDKMSWQMDHYREVLNIPPRKEGVK